MGSGPAGAAFSSSTGAGTRLPSGPTRLLALCQGVFGFLRWEVKSTIGSGPRRLGGPLQALRGSRRRFIRRGSPGFPPPVRAAARSEERREGQSVERLARDVGNN